MDLSGDFLNYEEIERQDDAPDTDDFPNAQKYDIKGNTNGRYLAIQKKAPEGTREYLELEEVAVYANVCEYS